MQGSKARVDVKIVTSMADGDLRQFNLPHE